MCSYVFCMLRCLIILQRPSVNIHDRYMRTNLSDSTIEAELICANKRLSKAPTDLGRFRLLPRADSWGSGTHASIEDNLTG